MWKTLGVERNQRKAGGESLGMGGDRTERVGETWVREKPDQRGDGGRDEGLKYEGRSGDCVKFKGFGYGVCKWLLNGMSPTSHETFLLRLIP